VGDRDDVGSLLPTDVGVQLSSGPQAGWRAPRQPRCLDVAVTMGREAKERLCSSARHLWGGSKRQGDGDRAHADKEETQADTKSLDKELMLDACGSRGQAGGHSQEADRGG
jgi:hypothetical protein